MTAHSMAMRAYTQTSSPIKTERQSEYDTIARVTKELKAASLEAAKDFPRLAAALHKNNELWTLLALDAAGKNNGLPKDLRARIVFLAEFTKRHAAQVLGRKSDVGPLLEINTAILRGLGAKDGRS